MDYQAIYNRLIDRARNRILEGYSESHHITPRCLGGVDSPDNIVDLTAREHYVAHQLLAKIHPTNQGINYAVHMMTVGENRSNRAYGWVKERLSRANSSRQSILMQEVGQRPEYKKWHSDHKKKLWQDPEYQAKMKARDEAAKKRGGAVFKELWNDPEYRKKTLGGRNKENYRKAAIERWKDPEYRAKVKAAKAKKRAAI